MSDAVAVLHEEPLTVDVLGQGAIDDTDAYFALHVVKEPDVVIAFEPGYFGA